MCHSVKVNLDARKTWVALLLKVHTELGISSALCGSMFHLSNLPCAVYLLVLDMLKAMLTGNTELNCGFMLMFLLNFCLTCLWSHPTSKALPLLSHIIVGLTRLVVIVLLPPTLIHFFTTFLCGFFCLSLTSVVLFWFPPLGLGLC